jgi:hypothetical protein
MADAKKLIYPKNYPVGSELDAGLRELGASFSRGGEGITPFIDYMKFSGYRYTYDGEAILDSLTNKGAANAASAPKETGVGGTVYLYMPSNIATSYGANYNQVAFGVGGVMAAQMLGSNSAEGVAASLKNAAGQAAPEAAFNSVGSAINGINAVIGVGGNINGADLSAVTQGRIFNPYEEQIFNGVTFRSHQFQWKLIARSDKEAQEISDIIGFFKTIMHPSFTGQIGKVGAGSSSATAGSPSPSKGGDKTIAESFSFAGSSDRRYMQVPSRLHVDFVRIGTPIDKSGASAIHMYRIKDCIVESVQVNYTPDGGYVTTTEGRVPAYELSINLKEVSILTTEDIANGY